MTTGTITIAFSSDWHCGTGHGQHGGVDRVTARDGDGLPYLTAKSLLGVWRDACETVAAGLDDTNTDRGWARLVDRVFGRPAGRGDVPVPERDGGLVDVDPARLERGCIEALVDPPGTPVPIRPFLRDGLVVTRFAVAVDDSTGVASDDTLREIEVARAGLTLHTSWTIPGTLSWPVALLLQSGARLVHHLGAHRRRGLGRCELTLAGFGDSIDEIVTSHRDAIAAFGVADADAAADTAADGASLSVSPPATAQGAASAVASPDPAGAYLIRRATVTVTTEAPVIAAKGVLGNTVRSHDYLPGATVLPIVAAALGPDARAWIRDARLVVTDATPVIATRRARRTPLSVVSGNKGRAWRDGGPAFDILPMPDPGNCPVPDDAKAVKGWSVTASKAGREAQEGLMCGSMALVTMAHAVIDDETARPGEDGLYSYQAIPAGTVLAFEVWDDGCLDGAGLAALEGLARKRVALGRAKRGDYGRATLTVSTAPLTQPTGDDQDRFQLRLSSDALLVDEFGIPSTDVGLLVAEVQQRLGAAYHLVVEDSRLAVTRVDSWTASNALPRESAVALEAGSVLLLGCTPAVPRAVLSQALSWGVGHRRAEGFGRLEVFEHSGGATPTVLARSIDEAVRGGVRDATLPTDGQWPAILRSIWSDELLRRARLFANDRLQRETIIGTRASAAQLGSLRTAAELLPGDVDAVRRWVASTRAVKARADAWGTDELTKLLDLGAPAATEVTGVALADAKIQWAQRLATALNPAANSGVQVPDDLGGVPAAKVAAWLVVECLREQAVALQHEHVRRSEESA